ncbi:DNA ligase 1 isoform X2 [Eurytemora carolleeae]|uniref:DNA ligase 1 isoform X2 n=1 Tax=Eurytemora carolleeae TaxID=1294199 RepID=UPI000C77555C|nr:DNA ligase 1 isoform X2 [Eurytemora carolleeae]|eukprot:XP_023349587.1 DNA ligase 1-like isoform X2 [Eurytemora affinis]
MNFKRMRVSEQRRMVEDEERMRNEFKKLEISMRQQRNREWRQKRNEKKEESSSSSPSHENQFFNFPISSSCSPNAPSAPSPPLQSSWLIKIENIENLTCSVPEWSQLIQNGGIKLIDNKTEEPNHQVAKTEEDFKEEEAPANSELEKDTKNLQTVSKRNAIKIMQESLPNKCKENFQTNVSNSDQTTSHNVEENSQKDELATSEENAPNDISEIREEKEKKLNTSQKKAISKFTSSLFKRRKEKKRKEEEKKERIEEKEKEGGPIPDVTPKDQAPKLVFIRETLKPCEKHISGSPEPKLDAFSATLVFKRKGSD